MHGLHNPLMSQNKMGRPDQQPQSQPDEPVPQTQIQLSDNSQTEDHSQVVILNPSKSHTTDQIQTPLSKEQVLAIVSLAIRVATCICLLASLIVLASDTSIIDGDDKIKFNDIYSYRYMMSAIVLGFVYTCVQLALEIYQISMGKRVIIGNIGLPVMIFYGDKFLLSILATGVGAGFGATFDFKKNLGEIGNFFNMAYASAGLLLIAFLCSISSSVLSSFALQKK